MSSKVVLSPFPLPPLYPYLWLAAPTPRLYIRSIPLALRVPILATHQTPSRIRRYLKNVNSTTSSFPVPPLTSVFPFPLLPPFGLMDRPPSRSLDSPRQSRRREKTPSISESTHPPQPGPVSGSTSTSLPPIRVLHPHLPPPNSNQFFGPSDPSAYPPSYDHPPPSAHIRYNSQHASHDQSKALETIEESDSDKHSSPPPKKRRKRQALSCTGQ